MRRRKYGGVTTTVEQAMIDPDQTFEVTEVGMNAGRVSSRRHSSRGTRASDASGTRCGHVILSALRNSINYFDNSHKLPTTTTQWPMQRHHLRLLTRSSRAGALLCRDFACCFTFALRVDIATHPSGLHHRLKIGYSFRFRGVLSHQALV